MFNRILIVCCFFALSLCKTPTKLSGEHICHREENYTETVNKTSPTSQLTFFSEGKEVARLENVTKTRTVKFCCPEYEEVELDDKRVCMPICKCINGNCTIEGTCDCNDGFVGDVCDEQCPPKHYGTQCKKLCHCGELNCHPITGACLKPGEKIILLSMKSEPLTQNSSNTHVDHNPYMLMNYSGEYGKQFNHYVKMGANESDVEESVKKIIEYEVRKAEEEYGQFDGYIILDVENNFEPIHHPQFVTDHHAAIREHDEVVAMVTVGCVILGMMIFLLAIVYIKRATSPRSPHIIHDPESGVKNKDKEFTKVAKIQHSPLPVTPTRPSLRKNKSVTFDESIDEVDGMDRRRTRSMPNALDLPEPEPKQPSMMDMTAKSIKITPLDIANFSTSQPSSASAVYTVSVRPPEFNTFPRKKISKKPTLERIYDEIPSLYHVSAELKNTANKVDSTMTTNEHTKM